MALNGFHPAVTAWFDGRFPEPTAPQARAWPSIQSRRHTLIAAPTGSGKTLAAFLAAIDDLVRVAEQVSGIQLDWYKEYWVNTTKTIDYKIDSLWEENSVSKIRLKRIGHMPMPIDLQLTFKDGSTEMIYVPLNLMFGAKPNENASQQRQVAEEWRWTNPVYVVETKRRLTDLKSAEIDPSRRMADVDRKNNLIELNW